MTITRVQGNKKGTSTTNSIVLTLDSTPAAGNLLIAVIGNVSTGSLRTVTGITQTNVAWTLQKANNYGNAYNAEIWAGVVSASAGTSITVALTGNADYGAVVNVCEYSGLLTTGYLDQTGEADDASSPFSTGTTGTTTQAEELWIGAITVYHGTVPDQSSPTNSFSLLDGAKYTYMSSGYLEKIVSSTGTAEVSVTAYAWDTVPGCIATFKASVPASGMQLFTLITQMVY